MNYYSKQISNDLAIFKKFIDEDSDIKSANLKMHDFLSEKIGFIEDEIIACKDFPQDLILEMYQEFVAIFRIANETREFNSALFAITLLDSSISIRIVESGFYSSFCECSFYNRKYSNFVNRTIVWDCVFNYFFDKFLTLYRVNFDRRIFEILALDKTDDYFFAFCTAVDKFCVERNISIPIDILDSFYKKDSRHFEKIKKMGLI